MNDIVMKSEDLSLSDFNSIIKQHNSQRHPLRQMTAQTLYLSFEWKYTPYSRSVTRTSLSIQKYVFKSQPEPQIGEPHHAKNLTAEKKQPKINVVSTIRAALWQKKINIKLNKNI